MFFLHLELILRKMMEIAENRLVQFISKSRNEHFLIIIIN